MFKLMFKHLWEHQLLSKTILNIKKWGNNLGVRLPARITAEAGLHEDQRVELRVENELVIISPVPKEKHSLAQRLKRFDPKRHGGETMATDQIGAEEW